MPDFDNNLQPIIKDGNAPILPPPVNMPAKTFSPYIASGERLAAYTGEGNSLDFYSKNSNFQNPNVFITNKTLENSVRYNAINPDVENLEDYKAYGQSNLKKATNGLLKGLTLTGTTILGGFGMLAGIPKAMITGRLADIWDNEITNKLDELNKHLDNEYLPNYYTQVEQDAKWYSTDNWFKANFLWDKLIKNSGYAAGAIISGNIANAGLLKTGAGLGKLFSAGEVAATSSTAFKTFTPLLRNAARVFSQGKNIEAANILEKSAATLAEGVEQSSQLAKLARTTNSIQNIANTGRRSLIALYSSAGEASFEALSTQKEFRDGLINEYIKTNGEEPTGQALKEINQYSDGVGKTSFFGNLAILAATEYAQLPYLMGSSFRAEKQVANSLLGKAGNVLEREGKYIADVPASRFGKLFNSGKSIQKTIFDPKEATQEGLQYALQVGSTSYWNKKYQSKDGTNWIEQFITSPFEATAEGLPYVTSKEGMESFILGGITGGLIQSFGHIKEAKQKKANTANFVSQLNNAPSAKQAFIERQDGLNRAVRLQEEIKDRTEAGDKLEATDLKFDYEHNYLAPRVKYGRLDMILEDISDMREQAMSEEGLSQLKEEGLANINDTTISFQKKLNDFEQSAKDTDALYKALNLRYSGITNKEGNKKYSPETIDKMAYIARKISNYDVRIPELSNPLSLQGVNVADVLERIINKNEPHVESVKEALQEINKNPISADENKTLLSDVIELSLRKKLLLEEYDDIKSHPENYEEINPDEFGESSELPVSVLQKIGRKKPFTKEVEIGKEYSLTSPVVREGNSILLSPKIKAISQTLGGEIEIEKPNGDVGFLTPEEFKQFAISDVDNSDQIVSDALSDGISKILKKKEYKDLEAPADDAPVQDKIKFINSLDDEALADGVMKQVGKEIKERAGRTPKNQKYRKIN